jgi:hypothetical protein
VGFIITDLARPAERVVAFYNQCGPAEQWIKERDQMDAVVLPHLRRQCRPTTASRARVHPRNFMRTLAMPKTAEPLTSLREKLIKIGAEGRQPRALYYRQMAEVAMSRQNVRPTSCR